MPGVEISFGPCPAALPVSSAFLRPRPGWQVTQRAITLCGRMTHSWLRAVGEVGRRPIQPPRPGREQDEMARLAGLFGALADPARVRLLDFPATEQRSHLDRSAPCR